MPVSIIRLRRWFAAGAILAGLLVLATYFHARRKQLDALKQVPERIGINIQQTAEGFTISKSEQGRTLFTLQANKAVQFKKSGQAELHEVTISLYGKDSSRFDRIYGSDFEYDAQSGNVTSKGEVSIDVQANPRGVTNPGQAAPKDPKNPIHLKTTDLVFNKNTGDAWTNAAVEFSVPQGSGSAVGARYEAKSSTLTLESKLKIDVHGSAAAKVSAERAILKKDPREILLSNVSGESDDRQAKADEIVISLREDNTLDHTVGTGNVTMRSSGRQPITANSQKIEVFMRQDGRVKNALLSGEVHLKTEGPRPAEAWAGRANLSFGLRNILKKVHADQQVRLIQIENGGESPSASANKRSPKNRDQGRETEIQAPAMDFVLSNRNRLRSAETSGPPEILITSASEKEGATRITAEKFTANFDSQGRPAAVHGAQNVRVLTSAASGDADRISTSDSIDANFRPGIGLQSLVQQGHFTYSAGTQRALADRASYTVRDNLLVLSGSPQMTDAGMATAARTLRFNRVTGDAFAEGDVKTSYSDLKYEPGGAMLASSDPVHVTARSMVAHKNSGTATYSGKARLWQNANVIEAPTIQFQKEPRMLVANSDSSQKVSTVIVGTGKDGRTTPVSISSNQLTYRDPERKAQFEGAVIAHSADLTITARHMDVLLASGNANSSPSATNAPSKLERIVASGSVVITDPKRRATGEQLTYTAADDKFVLVGGPPSIFDAEHGKITGVSLTLFRRDGRVVVEGNSSSPAITETRVVR